jgi:hypothetical protein
MRVTTKPIGGMLRVDHLIDRRSWSLLAARIAPIGLWILPALWKTPQTGVSHRVLENRTERGFPQAPQALLVVDVLKRSNPQSTGKR